MISFEIGKEIETIFLILFKQDAIDIADPSSMQDPCHMNFVIDP